MQPIQHDRGRRVLVLLALTAGFVTIALSVAMTDATEQAAGAMLFNSPIIGPRPILPITDLALARVLGERDQMRRRAMSTPPWTATVTRTPMVSFLGSAENQGFTNLAWFSVAYGDYRTRLMEPAPSQTPPSTLTVLGNQWASYNPAQPPTPTQTPTP